MQNNKPISMKKIPASRKIPRAIVTRSPKIPASKELPDLHVKTHRIYTWKEAVMANTLPVLIDPTTINEAFEVDGKMYKPFSYALKNEKITHKMFHKMISTGYFKDKMTITLFVLVQLKNRNLLNILRSYPEYKTMFDQSILFLSLVFDRSLVKVTKEYISSFDSVQDRVLRTGPYGDVVNVPVSINYDIKDNFLAIAGLEKLHGDPKIAIEKRNDQIARFF